MTRDLLLIPGPIEFDEKVLESMSHYSVGHTAPEFIQTFQQVLQGLRVLFQSKASDSQGLVVAGSGTLGWDITASNLVEPGEDVLVLSTGFFSDNFAECIKAYGAKVDIVKQNSAAEAVELSKVEQALKAKQYKVITITHVDTSSGVISDVKSIAALVKKVSPETLIVVDGVCSVGVEELRFDDWGLDYCLTASQKGVGVPSGLSISFLSGRAIKTVESRKTPITSFFASLNRWLPIMRTYESGKGAYFATPPIQLIYALHTSLSLIAPNDSALEKRYATHQAASDKIKDLLTSLGFKLVANRNVAAHGLSTVYLPEGVSAPDFLGFFKQHNIVIAAGIYSGIAQKYFRIGHMGVTVTNPGLGHVDKLVRVLTEAKKNFAQ